MKRTLIVLVGLIVVFGLGIVIYFADLTDGKIDFYPVTAPMQLFSQIGENIGNSSKIEIKSPPTIHTTIK